MLNGHVMYISRYLQRGQIFLLFIKISSLSIFACILPVPTAFWLRDGILLILSGAGLPRLCWTNKETATLSTSNLLLPQIKKMGLMRKEWNWDTSHFEPKTCFAVGEKKSDDMQPKQTRAINALWQSFNGRCDIQNFELCLSFYPHPNISDKFLCHFIFVEDKMNNRPYPRYTLLSIIPS